MDEITRCEMCGTPQEDGEIGGALASDEAWMCGRCSDWMLEILDQVDEDDLRDLDGPPEAEAIANDYHPDGE